MARIGRLLSLGVFWAACAFTLYMALKPDTGGPPLLPWDKALHFLTFYALSGLGALAYARRRLAWLILGLAAFGAAIEGLQALPLFGRDAEWGDWFADVCGIAAAFSPTLLPAIRDRLR